MLMLFKVAIGRDWRRKLRKKLKKYIIKES
jgi:hypothetical protein